MSVAEQAKAVYRADYRDQLEAAHFGDLWRLNLSRESRSWQRSSLMLRWQPKSGIHQESRS